jgi:FkbM family methyltransferase
MNTNNDLTRNPQRKEYMKDVLLSIRNTKILQKYCLSILVKNNINLDELVAFEFTNNYPTLVINDGTRLTAISDSSLPTLRDYKIPDTHIGNLLSYIIRYKFPHCMPVTKINTGFFPRTIFPSLLHRQHINTVYELPNNKQEEFKSAFTLRPGDQILEFGPFIGFGTLRMSQLVSPDGHIVSVEADTEAFNILNLNLQHNNIQNVTTLNYAISDVDDDNSLIYKGEQQANSIIKNLIKNGQTAVVKSRTILSIVQQTNFTPNFIILTINGAEYRALYACREFLQNATPLRIITPGWYHDREGKIGPRIVKLLSSLGFNVSYTRGMHIFAYK